MLMKGIRRHYDNVGRGAGRRRRRPGPARPGCTRSCWSPSCTSRRCGRWPTPRRPGPTCSRRCYVDADARLDRPAARGVGRAQHRRTRSRCCTRPTARSSGRSSSTPRRSARPTRAAWSRSTSRSTSSAAGGSSCCTTRPRCGSRAGCCSRPGVMVTSVPYQLRSSQIAKRARRRGSSTRCAPATCAAARSPPPTRPKDRDGDVR